MERVITGDQACLLKTFECVNNNKSGKVNFLNPPSSSPNTNVLIGSKAMPNCRIERISLINGSDAILVGTSVGGVFECDLLGSKQQQREIANIKDVCRSVFSLPDSNMYGVCGGKMGVLSLFDTSNCELKHSIEMLSNKTVNAKFQPTVENAKLSPSKQIVAMTGKECDLRLFNIETMQSTFSSKNVPNNKLDMPYPIWGTDLTWYDESQDDNLIAVSTAFNRVRLYDVRVKTCRPLHDVDFKKNVNQPNCHLNCIASSPSTSCLFFGDNYGNVTKMDLKKLVENGKYIGAAGSITCLVVKNSTSLFTASHDRYVRKYDLQSRELLLQAYCKEPVSAFVVIGGSDEEEEEEDAWSSLEEEEQQQQQQTNKRVKPTTTN